MLKELFDAISAKAVVATAPQIHGYDPRLYYVVKNGDKVEFRDRGKMPQRSHRPASLSAIAAFAAHHALSGTSSAWFNRNGVVFFPDDAEREDALTLTLNPSPFMKEIQSWSPIAGQCFDQKSLLKLLRIRFKGYLDDAARIVDAIRNVRWTQNENKEQVQLKGKASLGKNLTQEFVGVDNLPDYITFQIPLFDSGYDHNVKIECALEPDETNAQFRLTPVANAVEEAWRDAEDSLGVSLQGSLPESLPVYYGHPGK
jgi:hypothetical protein